jgi:hypothetical protein
MAIVEACVQGTTGLGAITVSMGLMSLMTAPYESHAVVIRHVEMGTA